MPSKRKKFNARFPPARIKKIMQTDEDIGKVAAPVPVIISRVLELFIESLVTKANVVTQDRNAKTLTPSHIKHVIISENKFDFLKDLVASVPDIHVDEEEDATNGESGPRPRGRPRKTNKEGIPRKRKPRKNRAKDNDVSHKSSVKKQCSEGSNTEEVDSDEDDDEETDDADEENVPIKHQSLKKDENNQNLKLMQTPVNHVQDTSSDQISKESKTTCYSAEPRLGEDSKLHPNNHQTTPCMSSTMDRMPCFDSRSPFPVVTGFHPSSLMIMPNSPHIPMPYPYPPPPSLPGMFPGMPPIVVNENDKDDDDDYDS